mgnify:CR=1 FL=1
MLVYTVHTHILHIFIYILILYTYNIWIDRLHFNIAVKKQILHLSTQKKLNVTLSFSISQQPLFNT